MSKIDQLIQKATEELNKAKDEDKAAAQAKVDALKEAKSAGVEMDNDEVNGLVTRKTSEVDEKWKGVIGMPREDAEQVFEQLNDDDLLALFSDGDSEDGDDKPVAERVQEALRSRDSKIESLSSTLSDVNRRYSSDKVEVAIEKAFRDAGLNETFLTPAKSLAAYDDLVKKVADGKPVTSEEISGKVESVKNLSGVWFKSGEDGENGDGDKDSLTVAGHRLKEEAVRPAIPATPDGKESSEITDEDRAAKATSVY